MSNITFDNINEITDNSRKVVAQNMNSADDLNAYQNVFIAALGHELGRLSTQIEKPMYRLAQKATESLWGELYQAQDDSEALKDCAQLVNAFKNECESAWVHLMWLLEMSQFTLEFGAYWAGQAAEGGNTQALEVCASHKANLAALSDIKDALLAGLDA